MTLPMLVFAGLVFLVGIPAAFRSRTAGALVAAYLAVQGLWMATGTALPALALFWIDAACIAAICTRAPVRDCYRGGANLFACLLWLERSWGDRIVLACFPLAWWVYAFDGSDWWALYAISLLQLLVASGEALHLQITRRGPSAAMTDDDRPSGGAEFAMAGRRWGGG